MVRTILSKKEFPKIKKLQKKFDIFRAVDVKAKEDLEMVELVSSEGVFRGFGKSTKKALKNASRAVKNHHEEERVSA
jgi:predicted RNase H-like HicB family nuclease